MRDDQLRSRWEVDPRFPNRESGLCSDWHRNEHGLRAVLVGDMFLA